MMPYDAYRFCQAERAKSLREMRHADQRAAQLPSAVSGLVRAITQTTRRPCPAAPGGQLVPVPNQAPAPRRRETRQCRASG
jgi:hypothetical protein